MSNRFSIIAESVITVIVVDLRGTSWNAALGTITCDCVIITSKIANIVVHYMELP